VRRSGRHGDVSIEHRPREKHGKRDARLAGNLGDFDLHAVGDGLRHHVSVNGRVVHLTSLEYKLLRTLVQRRGRVQERDRLLSDVWGYESVIDTRTVDTHVRRLREKLGKAGDAIETVRGFGYRLREG
jgi:DNA-binding response OmpR family regulator